MRARVLVVRFPREENCALTGGLKLWLLRVTIKSVRTKPDSTVKDMERNRDRKWNEEIRERKGKNG